MDPGDRSPATGDWSDYPVGVLRELQKLDIEPPPFRLELSGNVPLGAGLSSSASVEVATALALLQHCEKLLPLRDFALLCQRAENLYVGSPCGIMDQFVIAAGKAGHALLLNTSDLSTELLPMNQGALSKCVIVIVNSMVKHTVTAGSDYAQRRRELEAGQDILCGRFGLKNLGQADSVQLGKVREAMTDQSFRRCRHIVSENERVQEAAKAMCAGDPVLLGALMTAAHASERDDFECSVPEVDFLVETAVARADCFGARLTGGGFGGCTVNLVRAESATDFIASVRTAYRERFAITADAYLCGPTDGALAAAAAAGLGRPAEMTHA